METKNKLTTILNINNIKDVEHKNIVDKLINTISNLDNFLFRTLLSYIMEININYNNIQDSSNKHLTITDKENNNEYLIEIKDGFFCISILNHDIEDYIGEMITFQCSVSNDIFVSLIDEDILELTGNENAQDKRRIILC